MAAMLVPVLAEFDHPAAQVASGEEVLAETDLI
jgi:hypothetical protein